MTFQLSESKIKELAARAEAKRLETKIKWDKETKQWLCAFCGNKHERLYVVTGHDHTDYEIDFCKCRDNQRMNDLIRSIAWNADIGLPSDSTYTRTFMTSSDNIQKFAELIAKECIEITEKHPSWTAVMIGNQIRDHFGVE